MARGPLGRRRGAPLCRWLTPLGASWDLAVRRPGSRQVPPRARRPSLRQSLTVIDAAEYVVSLPAITVWVHALSGVAS